MCVTVSVKIKHSSVKVLVLTMTQYEGKCLATFCSVHTGEASVILTVIALLLPSSFEETEGWGI